MSDTATFTEFLDAIGVELEPGQRAFCLVALDGIQVADLTGEDRQRAIRIFGDLPRMAPESWAFVLGIIAIVAGGRSGKTYLCSLRLLHLALTVDLFDHEKGRPKLASGEEAFCAIVAPKLELAEQSLRYVAGACRANPALRDLIVSDTKGGLVLRRDDGEMVAIRPFAAAAGGIGGRGKSLIAVFLDETCFFRDANSGVVNDQAIFDAASVRVIEGGQTLVSSTPWVGKGLLHGLWKKNHEHPIDALSAHAATRTMRTSKHILGIVARAEARDPRNASIEFGAEWGATTVETFFTDAELAAFFHPEAPELGRVPQARERVSFGGDLGFVRNSSTLAGVHELPDGLVLLAHLEEHQPSAGGRLKPSVVCKGFARVIAGQGGSGMVADSHERASLDEHLTDAGLVVYPAPSASDALIAFRAGIREGLVRCPAPPADDEAPTLVSRLRQQMVDTRQRRTVGDRVVAVLPEGLDGSHGDMLVAVAQAIWGLGRWGGAEVRPHKPAIDPRENPREAMRQALMDHPKDQRKWMERWKR